MFDYQRVRRLRETMQLSENQFAKKIGVSQSTYNRFEKGQSSLPAEALVEIVRVYGVDSEWLLLGTGGEDPVFRQEKKKEDVDRYAKILEKLTEVQEELIEYKNRENSRLKNDTDVSDEKQLTGSK